jgi:hypothetical protein
MPYIITTTTRKPFRDFNIKPITRTAVATPEEVREHIAGITGFSPGWPRLESGGTIGPLPRWHRDRSAAGRLVGVAPQSWARSARLLHRA